MPEPVWYRSLYWRIALAFVALLAVLLVVQGFVFFWITGQLDELSPSRSPSQFVDNMAADLSGAIVDRPDLDLERYVMTKYGRALRGFAVVMTDQRVVVSDRIPPPPQLVQQLRGRLMREAFGRGGGPRRGGGPGDQQFGDRPGNGPPPPPPGGFGDRGPRDFRGGGKGDGRGGPGPGGGGPPGPPPVESEFIVANGDTIGIVGVPTGSPPWGILLRDVGPMLAAVALGLLAAGTAIAALVVFRPTHRRLRALQDAAAAVGEGASGVRAPENGGDEVAALAHTFNDMAGRLEDRTRALEVADRTRRQLLADVSHELSTPLAAIRGYVETLEMGDDAIDPAARQRYLQIVAEETVRLEHIIGDLLDLARLEGGGGTFADQTVSVPHLLGRIHDRHARALEKKQITLETIGSPDVPSLRGDGVRLEQAVQNLVANAVRHTPEGGRITVRVEPDDQPAFVKLVVEDTGPGIPEEHLPYVFDRFYKVDASRAGTTVPSGSGLGLSIVQAIVQRHGGTVTAANAPDAGARFVVTLPKAPNGGAGL